MGLYKFGVYGVGASWPVLFPPNFYPEGGWVGGGGGRCTTLVISGWREKGIVASGKGGGERGEAS
jgi:hypothetical protein